MMFNTQQQGLRDPENHPFAFKAYSATSRISQEEGILLCNRRLGNGVFVKGKVILFMGWESKTFFGPDHLYLSVLHTEDKLLDSLKCWLFYNNTNNNIKIFPAVGGCSFSLIGHYVCKTNW